MIKQLFPRKRYSYFDESEEAKSYRSLRVKIFKKFSELYGYPTDTIEYVTEMMAGERHWPTDFDLDSLEKNKK